MAKKIKSTIDDKILSTVIKAKKEKKPLLAAFRELAPTLNTTAVKLQNRWYTFTSKLAIISTDIKEKKANTCFFSINSNAVAINRSFFIGVNEVNLTKTQYNKILDIIYGTQEK